MNGKRIRAGIPFWLVLLFTGFLVSCSSGPDAAAADRYDTGRIHISCDESFKPVIDAQVQVYEARRPNTELIVHYKPEADCIRDFAVDSIRMVIITRRFTPGEQQFMLDSMKVSPTYSILAYDAIAVIVHPSAPDSMFTMPEIRALLSGKLNKKLIPVFDGVRATSTVRFMIDSVLRGEPLGKNVVAAKSSEGVIDYVSRNPEAVGFLGVSWVGNDEDTTQRSFLKKVKIAYLESTDKPGGFVQPLQGNIYAGRYPLVRELVCIVKERHVGLAHGFAAFMSGDDMGQEDIGQLIFRRAYLRPAKSGFFVREAELGE